MGLKPSSSGRLKRASRFKVIDSRSDRQSALCCLSEWHQVGSRCACCLGKAAKAAAPGGVDTFSFPPPCPPARSSSLTIMAPNLAVAQREQIHAMLQAGRFTGDQIAKVAGCSSQTVSAIRSNIRAFGNSREPFTAAPGRPRSITPTMFDALNELLLGKPDRQLDELAAFFREEFDVDVSTSTISRTLIAEGWSKKMVRRKAKEQSADLRDKYLHELSAFASCHLVYIDESGCDRRVGFRRTGWSPVGITPVQTERFHWGQRYHILPAYTQDGVLLARIYQGSTDGEVFEDFLGELLQWYGRWP
ncbi:hypothetical protein MBLNU13_g09049t1 [Cladosporium sp. NU13]